jgi:hypothetical protein
MFTAVFSIEAALTAFHPTDPAGKKETACSKRVYHDKGKMLFLTFSISCIHN